MPEHSVFPPAAYLRALPDDTFVSSNGFNYHIWGGGVVYHYVNGTNAPLLMKGFTSISFSQGAIATLPTSLRYIKTGDIWLLAPIPVTTPVVLTGQVPAHQEYLVIKQIPRAGHGPIVHPASVIPFNIPMSCAKTGDFLGASDPVFAPPARAAVKCDRKITIAVNVLVSRGNKSLKSSSQVTAPATKGRLAKAIAREVKTALDAERNVLVAFFNEAFVREMAFEDLFLVDLVRVSKSTYQPTIALRVYA